MAKSQSALLTDLYQLNMMAAYLEHGLTETAVFELFVRKLPSRRGFLMAAGLEQALQFLETVSFTSEDLKKISGLGQFSESFLAYLRSFRFTGDVDAMPEGTVFFPDEPILRVTAPLPEAQFVETRLVNLLHFQTVVASKAARHGACCAGKAADRLRSETRTWRRGRAARGSRQLHRRVQRHGNSSRRARIRHPRLRHDGAFFHPSA